MKPFHFSKTYFNLLKYEDLESNLRVIIKENSLLIGFLGEGTIKKVVENYNDKK